MSVDPATRFPGESDEYRLVRNRLLAAEIELRRTIERVAAQRRALPPGGAVPHDYVFEETADGGGQVRFSELFAPGKDTLVIYSFMFPRWSGDTETGSRGGRDGPAAARRDAVPVVYLDPGLARRRCSASRPPAQLRCGRQVRSGSGR